MTAAVVQQQNTIADLFSWLQALDVFPKIYWASRNRTKVVAAAGVSDNEDVPLFSWRMFSQKSGLEWSEFSTAAFHPQLIVTGDVRKTFPAPHYNVLTTRLSPNQHQWIVNIEQALSDILKRELDKIVLARKVELECDSPIDPIALCRAIDGPGRTVFLFQPSKHTAFVGATPERLYKRIGRDIQCDAMAGTCLRGLEADLMNSKKDFREFRIVQERLIQTLAPFCRTPPQSTPTSIRSTPTLSHLYSRITGELKEGVEDDDLLDALHPTPAVGGWPKEQALARLSSLEPFTRGLYAAPIGWQSVHEAEYAVALRSCLIQGSKATLFAGTGIVEGSDPLLEWEESSQKMIQWKRFFKSFY